MLIVESNFLLVKTIFLENLCDAALLNKFYRPGLSMIMLVELEKLDPSGCSSLLLLLNRYISNIYDNLTVRKPSLRQNVQACKYINGYGPEWPWKFQGHSGAGIRSVGAAVFCKLPSFNFGQLDERFKAAAESLEINMPNTKSSSVVVNQHLRIY